DEAIGKIVATLASHGLRENTLIVFSSDNGGPNPVKVSDNGPLRAGKGTIYEGGVRVCAFANWPGHIPSGVTNHEPMHAVDWFPTLVKLAGGSLEQKLPLDGRDVWPMLTQGAKSPHEAILSASTPTRAAVRMGDWKLLLNASEQDSEEAAEGATRKGKNKKIDQGETVELYNLATDIGETTNLATGEPERVATMRAKLNLLLKDAAPQGHLGKEDGAIKAPGKAKQR
ncbi:MAG: Arylsulfatase, partial [Verrucomicrobiota bacterium]